MTVKLITAEVITEGLKFGNLDYSIPDQARS